jgi:hypothetical protein
MCRGAVSGGTGDDHMRSNADTALERRRRRAEVLVAVIVMGGRYSRARHFRQPGPTTTSPRGNDIVGLTNARDPGGSSVGWRNDLSRMWVGASLVWAVALHVLIAIEKPSDTDWSSVMAEDAYWLFLLVPPLGMGLMIWAIAWIITRWPRLPN